MPLEALHCQPPLLDRRQSAADKSFSPNGFNNKSLVRKLATIMAAVVHPADYSSAAYSINNG